jgi:S1-C subfamily serine protease
MSVPRWLAAYLLASLAAGALVGAAVMRYGAPHSYVSMDPAPSALDRLFGNSTTTLSLLRPDELQTIDVVRRASPAVVSIVITKELTERSPDDFFSDLFNDRFFSLPAGKYKVEIHFYGNYYGKPQKTFNHTAYPRT